jgi:hypothetical protein
LFFWHFYFLFAFGYFFLKASHLDASITPSSPFKITVILLFADGFGCVFSPDFGKFSISAALSLPDIC